LAFGKIWVIRVLHQNSYGSTRDDVGWPMLLLLLLLCDPVPAAVAVAV
jgi:hypothetical protein